MACCTVATAAKRAARRSSSPISSVVNELHRHRACDDARLDAFVEEKANGTSTALTIVERPIVDIHSHEGIGFSAVQAPRESHRVIECILAVVETIRDALAKMSRNFSLKLARHVLAD